jgi:DNA adenine methylase
MHVSHPSSPPLTALSSQLTAPSLLPSGSLRGSRPLLKWAGGKRQLLEALSPHYPGGFTRFIEPFFGSGAVFFDLHGRGALRDRQAKLADVNPDLVGCYRMVRDRADEVIAALKRLEAAHRKGGDAVYYKVRDERFNPLREALHQAHDSASSVADGYTPALAAMVIFLNRTGFNGLFRLNSRGGFNVPAGRYTAPRICDEAHVREVAAAFQAPGVTFDCVGFDAVLADAGPGDFVYCDPPYAPLSRTASFAHYTAGGFSAFDQRRLQQAVIAACRRGAHVVLSNSSAPEIVELYSKPAARKAGLHVHLVPARRSINSRGASRGPVNELIVSPLAVGKLRMAKATLGKIQAPAIHTSLRQLGHANASRRSATNDT